MDTPLQCKKCSGSFKDGKCSSCGSHVAVAADQFEGDNTLRSRLDGREVKIHFGKFEEPGLNTQTHINKQE